MWRSPPVLRKTGWGRGSHVVLKFSVESQIPYMVIALRDGIFNVWQMYQHTVRKCLLIKERHFVGYIFPSVALVDLHGCTLSWPMWIFHGELNVDPCGILPICSDICSLTTETFWAVQKRRYQEEESIYGADSTSVLVLNRDLCL